MAAAQIRGGATSVPREFNTMKLQFICETKMVIRKAQINSPNDKLSHAGIANALKLPLSGWTMSEKMFRLISSQFIMKIRRFISTWKKTRTNFRFRVAVVVEWWSCQACMQFFFNFKWWQTDNNLSRWVTGLGNADLAMTKIYRQVFLCSRINKNIYFNQTWKLQFN